MESLQALSQPHGFLLLHPPCERAAAAAGQCSGSLQSLLLKNLLSLPNGARPHMQYRPLAHSLRAPHYRKQASIMTPRALVESDVQTSRTVDDARESLLDAISGVGGRGRVASDLQKRVIDDCVRVLEEDGGLQNPTEAEALEGRWQLVYTTRPGTASPIQRSFVGIDAFTVFQEIVLTNTDDPRVTNIVNFGKKIGELQVEAVASIATGVRINFRFDRAAFCFNFLPFKVPYPVPFKLLGDEAKGWLDTVYLSPEGDLRISKGNKGTTFVLQRNPGPRQKLLLAVKSKRDVEQAIEELKPLNPNTAPAESEALSGKWRLVWTSQARNANPLQKLSAGFASNWQIIDGETGTLENLVTAVFGFVKLRANADTERDKAGWA